MVMEKEYILQIFGFFPNSIPRAFQSRSTVPYRRSQPQR